MKCICCLKERKEYVSGLCKECSNKMDKHLNHKKINKENIFGRVR